MVKTVVNEELVGVDFGLQRSDVEKAGDTTHSNSAHKGNKILHFWLSSHVITVHLACQTWRDPAITLSLIRLENTVKGWRGRGGWAKREEYFIGKVILSSAK